MKHIKLFNEDFINKLENRVTAIYNADKQELIGIFSTMAIASKYLFGFKKSGKFLTDRVKLKIKIKNSLLGCNIAIRYANEKQKEIIGNKLYIILNKDYPEMKSNLLKGSTDLRAGELVDYTSLTQNKKKIRSNNDEENS